MRCLHCRYNGIKVGELICPRCTAHLPFLMRDVLIPGTLLEGGRYRLDYPIGRGGFGITYRAIQVKFERHVAIKEFFPREHVMRHDVTGNLLIPTARKHEYQKALIHFLEEGRLLSQLNHQNVVQVIDYFEERDTAYLVMQLIDGCTLRDKLEELPDKRLPMAEVKSITEQLVSALNAIHKKGIYHLDISPDNVQLTNSGQVVLIDFGAARQELNSETVRAFKLAYAAPEVLAGGRVGERSDLFELAMMIHELLTGSLPPSVLARLAGEKWDPGQIAEPWKGLLTAALHMDMDKRPASVLEWWDGFDKLRDNIILPSPRLSTNRKRVKLPRTARPAGSRIDKARLTSNKTTLRIGSRNVLPPNGGEGHSTERRAKLTKWRSRFDIALKLLGCIVFSCVLGLAAYLLAYNLLKPDLNRSPHSGQSMQGQQVLQQQGANNDGAVAQYNWVSPLAVFAFIVVALVTFVLLGGRLLAGGENDDGGH